MEQQLVSLFVTSVISLLLLVGRTAFSEDTSHDYLILNLFLAWIPYVLSLVLWHAMRTKKTNKAITLAGCLLWLLFFPNAPYIITDFIHLKSIPPLPVWYDAMLLSAFAFHGIVLGVASLQIMKHLVETKFGTFVGRVFFVSVVMLSSVGIYLGRVLRWNSWDVLLDPTGILRYLGRQRFDLQNHWASAVFILTFSVFFFLSYALFSPLLVDTKRKDKD
jgi:uncharacterized membrane protein